MEIVDKKLAELDKNGIWISKSSLETTDANTQAVWENIYGFDEKKLASDRKNFFEEKLKDHLKYITPTYKFDKNTVYLEIGCGPSYIGEHLIRKYDVTFVGVDFNYQILLELKKYLEKNNLNKFILIYSDINKMPVVDDSIDYIYGGGVIEHVPNTSNILNELYRTLKKGGVSFNTIPAFNLWWLSRFYNNIPALPLLKSLFEKIHIGILKYKILDKYYGYELSYTEGLLEKLHRETGFSDIDIGAFAISPAKRLLSNKLLANIYLGISRNKLTTPVYWVSAKK